MEQEVINLNKGISRSPSFGEAGEMSELVNLIPKHGELVAIEPPKDLDIEMGKDERLLYVHKTSSYENYISSVLIKGENSLRLYYKQANYLQLIVIPEYPVASDLAIPIRILSAGTEMEVIVRLSKGASGKQVYSYGSQTSYIGCTYSHEDEFYNYAIEEIDDTDDASDDATWSDEPAAFEERISSFTKEDATRTEVAIIKGVSQVQALGNTLIALGSDGVEYILYKNGAYKHLGKKPPLLDPYWNLIGRLDEKERNITLDELGSVQGLNNLGKVKLKEELSTALTQEAAALANTYIAENAEQGRFTSSFFVCAAYKMLGGHYMMSAPILMRLNDGYFPLIGADYVGISLPDGVSSRKLTLHAYSAILYCSNLPLYSSLVEWKDIITGIEIFVSSPIRRYNQDGKIEYISSINNDSISYSVVDDAGTPSSGIVAKRTLLEKGYFLYGMQKEDNDYYEQFKASQFYKIKSISLDEMSSGIYSFGESLVSLETLEQLDTSGYQQHDVYTAKKAFVYNNRINLYGVQEIKRAFPMLSLAQYTNGYVTENGEVSKTYQWNVRYVISSGGQKIEVTNTDKDYMYEEPTYLFYPDNNVEEVILERIDGSTIQQATLSMESHPYLQGSYWFNNFKPITWLPATERLATTEGIIKESNKLYTSEVNNPFIFPLGGINTIGTGEIVGVSTTTKALSQGQFGQFPLYVFATDGIWAMEVGSTGLYSSIHAVSRDVCNNADSITQIDMAVVFSTEQGLKMLQGSDVVLLSGKMEGINLDESPYDVVSGWEGLFIQDTEQFVDMLRTCKIVYDYPHKLLHIYPSSGEKHFLYSIEENAFSSYVGHSLKSYALSNPNTIVQLGNKLYDYSYNHTDALLKGLAITRPLALGDTFALKMLNDLRSVKRLSDGSKVQIAVWGNNTMDENGWVRLPSLRQHSFKYYRFALFTNMSIRNAISGLGIRYDYRRTNKMR